MVNILRTPGPHASGVGPGILVEGRGGGGGQDPRKGRSVVMFILTSNKKLTWGRG